jgi:hypothetical protein
MKSNCQPTVELPTVEECREAAMDITDDLLRMCVRRQCGEIEVKCSEAIRRKCKEDSKNSRRTVLAYTFATYDSLHLFFPVGETHWCEESASHGCVAKSVIHELAHSCGWHHDEGKNVPGNNEDILECDCASGNDGTSCR